MPLLAPADRRILRELLVRGGTAEIGEISAAVALDIQAVQLSLGTLRRSAFAQASLWAVEALAVAHPHGSRVGPSSLSGNDLSHDGDDLANLERRITELGFPPGGGSEQRRRCTQPSERRPAGG